MSTSLPFGLPPSMGQEHAARRARRLEAYLGNVLAREVVVKVAASYESLEKDLLSGAVTAAWGPPFVCARTEAYGGRGLVRGIRDGSATYRSAIIALKARKLTLESEGLKAAWVDRDSTAGYLLPQALLRDRGMHGWKKFTEERFAGSYRAAVEDVLAGRADLTAVWASGEKSAPATALGELVGPRAGEFEVLAYSRESPNDGVVLSSKSDDPTAAALERAFLTMHEDAEGLGMLAEVFQAERFEPAPRGSYRALYDLVFAALPG
ncbi:MAG: phosphate/phosphite/phosphonate ABC transporter substrate-binding protein [Deltaproteobacteria bacterium]|nr:phosphate/phosphite/phosphonate ABC transporter substrate-binding protein [Deltaproteobacteria bacterium]